MKEHRDLWWESPTAELGKVVQLDLAVPFRAEHGGYLPSIQVSYESWGALNEAKDNAVLVIHPMTADCHATGEFAGQPTVRLALRSVAEQFAPGPDLST